MAGGQQQAPTGGASRGVILRDFSGGLNNVSDVSAIGDNELADIVNLEMDAGGSLVSRPPITLFAHTPITSTRVEFTNLATNPRAATPFGTVATVSDGDRPGVLGFVPGGESLGWQSTVRSFSGGFSVAVEWLDGPYPNIYFPDTIYPA